jgi:hypothetical protein
MKLAASGKRRYPRSSRNTPAVTRKLTAVKSAP